MGFRYKKEVNGEAHHYIFDGWSITAETNKDGELKSREVRGYGLVKKEIGNNQYYYHQNEHGDITHLTNIDEEVENNYQYDVFGNIKEQQENVENVFKYAGEQQDQETEQYYLRARFYNPVIARFTQEDVYRGDGLNLYVYVVNNPLLWFDASGHEKCPINNDDKNNIPWSSRIVSEASKQLDAGETTITVISRSQAEELLLGKFVGEGYRNVTGMTAIDVKEYWGDKAHTYHWDDEFGSDGRLLNHSKKNDDGKQAHLQIHPKRGKIIRILFGERKE